LVESSVFNDRTHTFSAGCQEAPIMRSLFRTFSFVLLFLLLFASSDAAINTHGYRSGRSIAATQSGGVVTVYPSANQTPADPSN
jgi:hypothetical protein